MLVCFRVLSVLLGEEKKKEKEKEGGEGGE